MFILVFAFLLNATRRQNCMMSGAHASVVHLYEPRYKMTGDELKIFIGIIVPIRGTRVLICNNAHHFPLRIGNTSRLIIHGVEIYGLCKEKEELKEEPKKKQKDKKRYKKSYDSFPNEFSTSELNAILQNAVSNAENVFHEAVYGVYRFNENRVVYDSEYYVKGVPNLEKISFIMTNDNTNNVEFAYLSKESVDYAHSWYKRADEDMNLNINNIMSLIKPYTGNISAIIFNDDFDHAYSKYSNKLCADLDVDSIEQLRNVWFYIYENTLCVYTPKPYKKYSTYLKEFFVNTLVHNNYYENRYVNEYYPNLHYSKNDITDGYDLLKYFHGKNLFMTDNENNFGDIEDL